ncbi:MAG: hypothetical protein ACXWUG_27445 [Polyangiales bacterium]
MKRALLAIAIVFGTKAAHASASFPAVVEKVTSAKVGCATCHRTLDAGTDLTLFGAALKARGAAGKDDASLEAALAKMKTDLVDSDGDGARDLDEISWGGDPNVADLPPEVPGDPHYGFCSTSFSHRSSSPIALFSIAFLALGLRSRAIDRTTPRHRRQARLRS